MWENFLDTLCGFDEAGRGPLAGPVTAGACILGPDFPADVLADSKKLTEMQREAAYPTIVTKAAAWGIGWVWPHEIDRINILNASLLAMTRAWEDLVRLFPAYRTTGACTLGVADGLYIPQVPFSCIPLVKADDLCPPVSAASILAKVARDRWMERYSWIEPLYGYEKHKGYPTKAHIQALTLHGPSPIQRLSFQWKSPQTELDFGS